MQSPFILEATVITHPKVIEDISDDMYVDDLTPGGNRVREIEILKENSEELLKKVFSIYASCIVTYCH